LYFYLWVQGELHILVQLHETDKTNHSNNTDESLLRSAAVESEISLAALSFVGTGPYCPSIHEIYTSEEKIVESRNEYYYPTSTHRISNISDKVARRSSHM
jgi:ABC-type transport system substrate-binding protein